MKIRKARKKDTKGILKLLHHLFTQEVEFSFDKEIHKFAINQIIKNSEIGEIFVCAKHNKIIGCVNILYTISTALGGKVAILEDMIVLPKHRSRGVGQQIMTKVLKYLKSKNIQRITLLTDGDNLIAHNFYNKFNFNQSSMKVFRYKY
ncbi:MAG: GNAT family N-acetyltransferase [Arcobacter sp.]|nr:GNAT family N-acetyltransferase [Arcobacter sp.]